MFAGEVFAGDALLAYADERADDRCDGDGGEDCAVLLDVEAVAGGEDDWDRREGEVEYAPGKGNPQAEEEDDTFREEEMEGSVQADRNHLAERCEFFVALDFPADPLRSSLSFHRGHHEAIVALGFELINPLVYRLGFLAEEHRTAGLLEQEHDKDHQDTTRDGLQVEDPTPGCVIGDNATNSRSQSGSKKCSSREQGHGGVAIFGAVDVADDAANHRAECAAAASSEESTHDHASISRRDGANQLEENEEQSSSNEDGPSSVDLR